jgi:uncharacterized protein YjdB
MVDVRCNYLDLDCPDIQASIAKIKATVEGNGGTFEYSPQHTRTPPTITTLSLLWSAFRDEAYSRTLAATGDEPITWSIETGSLPPGLTLSESGTISGIPAVAGVFSFTIKAENASGFDTRQFTITVNVIRQYDVFPSSVNVTAAGNATGISTAGGTLQLTAAVLPDDVCCCYTRVVWSSSNPNIAAVDCLGSINFVNSGLVTARGNGTVTIKATTAYPRHRVIGTIELTITGQPARPVTTDPYPQKPGFTGVITRPQLQQFTAGFTTSWLNASRYNYGTLSYESLVTAVDYAKAVLNDNSSESSDFTAAYYFLSAAYDELVRRTSGELQILIQDAKHIYDTENIFNDELDERFEFNSWLRFMTAYEDILFNTSADGNVTTDLWLEFNEAFNGLQLLTAVTITELNQLLRQAEQLQSKRHDFHDNRQGDIPAYGGWGLGWWDDVWQVWDWPGGRNWGRLWTGDSGLGHYLPGHQWFIDSANRIGPNFNDSYNAIMQAANDFAANYNSTTTTNPDTVKAYNDMRIAIMNIQGFVPDGTGTSDAAGVSATFAEFRGSIISQDNVGGEFQPNPSLGTGALAELYRKVWVDAGFGADYAIDGADPASPWQTMLTSSMPRAPEDFSIVVCDITGFFRRVGNDADARYNETNITFAKDSAVDLQPYVAIDPTIPGEAWEIGEIRMKSDILMYGAGWGFDMHREYLAAYEGLTSADLPFTARVFDGGNLEITDLDEAWGYIDRELRYMLNRLVLGDWPRWDSWVFAHWNWWGHPDFFRSDLENLIDRSYQCDENPVAAFSYELAAVRAARADALAALRVVYSAADRNDRRDIYEYFKVYMPLLDAVNNYMSALHDWPVNMGDVLYLIHAAAEDGRENIMALVSALGSAITNSRCCCGTLVFFDFDDGSILLYERVHRWSAVGIAYFNLLEALYGDTGDCNFNCTYELIKDGCWIKWICKDCEIGSWWLLCSLETVRNGCMVTQRCVNADCNIGGRDGTWESCLNITWDGFNGVCDNCGKEYKGRCWLNGEDCTDITWSGDCWDSTGICNVCGNTPRRWDCVNYTKIPNPPYICDYLYKCNICSNMWRPMPCRENGTIDWSEWEIKFGICVRYGACTLCPDNYLETCEYGETREDGVCTVCKHVWWKEIRVIDTSLFEDALKEENPVIIIDDNSGSVITEEILELIREADKSVEIQLPNGLVLTIDPESITENARAIDLNIGIEITSQGNQIEGIPANNVVIIPPTHGDFGFEIKINIPQSTLQASGLNGNNIHVRHIDYDGKITLIGRFMRENNGSLNVSISHASQYVLSDTVTSVTITGAGSRNTITASGGTLQLFAAVAPGNVFDTSVTWKSNNTSFATVDAITGLVTARANGTVIITATSNDDSSVSRTFSITVSGQGSSPPAPPPNTPPSNPPPATTPITPTVTITVGTSTWAVTNIPRTALTALGLSSDILIKQIRVPTGATGNISMSVGEEFAGKNAVLVQYNQATEQLEFVSAVTIDENGNVNKNITQTGDFLVLTLKTGDVTGTGTVDTGDALALLRHVAGISELNSIQQFVANGKEGDVGTNDALQILRYVAGIIDKI